ncbi:uncharacterized protein DNG_07190 [Cephalotrichum gorgonifer]|uniref:Uncharacterized protein n=1 Tax=Cephalotrichum gorgonifer TaxID=2041049 RepID=A0AAE8N162_9PEZI|nr:uncharacterized protein DNG_07190 [Cephalotrichum gorgonifer]
MRAGSSSRAVHRVQTAQLWRRSFASTSAAQEQHTEAPKKVIFDPTSDPKLDDILTEMLHKIILPARLPKDKLKIISHEKNAQKLRVDPVIIEVEGYEHRFPILDFTQDTIPKSSALLKNALKLMKTREDWGNLVRILAGYRNAGRHVTTQQVLDLIRYAGKTGNIYAVIDAFRNVKESRLRIRSVPRADAILHYIQAMAVDADYAEKEARQAKTWAILLRELMEDGDHAKVPAAGRVPLHREPSVVGQTLHAVASYAALHQGGKDVDGKVAELAATLTHVWPEGKNLAEIHKNTLPDDAAPGKRIEFMQESDAHLAIAISRRISATCFTLRGIEHAKEMVEPEVAAGLAPIEEVLRADLAALAAKRDTIKADVGWAIYDKLMKA